MKTRFIILGLIALALVVGVVASTVVNDLFLTIGTKVLINDTGYYTNSGSSKLTKAYDVVICSYDGTNPEVYQECDVVDTSIDSSPSFSQCNKLDCKVRNGIYNINSPILLYSNTTIDCDSNVIFNLSSNGGFASGESNLNNLKIEGCKFWSILPDKRTISPLNFTSLNGSDNILFSHLEFKNINSTAILLRTIENATSKISNSKIEFIKCTDTLGCVDVRQLNDQNPGSVSNVVIDNVHSEFTPTYYNSFYNSVRNVVYLGNVNNARVSNIFSINKSTDDPMVYIIRSQNVDISNIYTYYQHDFALTISDGCKNININNIKSESPKYWGSLNIINDYFIDEMRDIQASNIECLNCDSGEGYPAIYILQDSNNAPPMKNIIINNFYINKSGHYGAIHINARKGNIDGLEIKNGLIENVDESGIYFSGSNLTTNLKIENVRVIDSAMNVADTNKKTCFSFDSANITKANIRDTFCVNLTSPNLNKGFKIVADASSEIFEGVLENNRVEGLSNNLVYSPFGSYVNFYSPEYNYTTMPSCTQNSIFDGKMIFNSTGGNTSLSVCQGGRWFTTSLT